MKTKQIKVVTKTSNYTEAFNKEVNELIREGWELQSITSQPASGYDKYTAYPTLFALLHKYVDLKAML